MKRILFLIVTVMFATYNGCAQQNKMKTGDIKEIWVYDYFNPRGYTTAGAYSQFKEFDENNIFKFKLDQLDVDTLICIMSKAKAKKIFQTKMGGNLLFAEIITEKNIKLRTIICFNLISTGAMTDYWIKDEKHQKWLSDFRNRLIDINH
jgi:hypothetical protein